MDINWIHDSKLYAYGSFNSFVPKLNTQPQYVEKVTCFFMSLSHSSKKYKILKFLYKAFI